MSWYTKANGLQDIQTTVNNILAQAKAASSAAIDFTAKVPTEQITEYYAVRKKIDDVYYSLANLSGVVSVKARMASTKTAWSRTENTKTIKITCSDLDDSLENLLTHIKKTGGGGHSFSIIVDPDDPDHREQFGWDGDGSDRIFEIEVSKG